MLLVYGFLGLVALGASLLMLPMSTADNTSPPITQALFTCVSAVTVTGLIVVDTAEAWSRFGQVVILGLLFLGGLGFMTGVAFLAVIVGQRLSIANQLIIREGMGGGQLGSITSVVRGFVIVAIFIQLVGATMLFLRWYVFGSLWEGISLPDAIWHSVYHAVSAFNNAGIEVLPDEKLGGGSSLIPFRDDIPVLAIMGGLIVLGSLGFAVLRDLVVVRRYRNLRLETKLILVGTLALIPVGVGLFFLSERNNEELTRGLSSGAWVGDAIFHSVAARTAGFATFDYALINPSSDVSTETLMFIGGASASTAGGVKINTFMVVIFAIFATIRGRRHVAAFGREISLGIVQRAMVISAMTALSLLGCAYLLVTVQDTLPFREAFFEAVSASVTVGLSMGITADLNEPARIVLIFAMFLGRLGPVTLALLMAGRTAPERVRMAQENVRIG